MRLSDRELATKNHKYAFGGEPFPSVTRITGLIDDNKSMAMAGAAAKITREGGDFRREWKEKAARGSRIHDNVLARWLTGGEALFLTEDAGFVDAGERYLAENPHEWLHVERVIVGNGWGGRFDAIGRDADGRIVLRDWKTGRKYVEHILQLSAYANGLGFATYDDDGNYAGLEDMPKIEAAGCVYLNGDGSYSTTEYSRAQLDDAYEVFKALLATYTWLEANK